jgi:Zn finger protein HypA/HybF involved in hydrogenase expression
LKNVIIHKVVTFVFTEEQLRGYWNRQKQQIPFESLTYEQLMTLAETMLQNSSHSQLEQHILNHGWRTKEETEGFVLAEDESREDIHIEVIDTEKTGQKSTKLFIDRLLQIQCQNCSFSFYIRNVNVDTSHLKCPNCSSTDLT